MKSQYTETLLPDVYSSSHICIIHYQDNAQAQKEGWKERMKEKKGKEGRKEGGNKKRKK